MEIKQEGLPQFNKPVTTTIERYPTGEKCQMFSVDSLANITDNDLERIVQICNEERIYTMLFKEKFQEKPYVKSDAEKFINWAKEGWIKNKWFTLIIRNPENEIVAVIDIKSDNLADAEIGYWATESYPGVITNSVNALCSIAKVAGYKKLHALIKKENEKSYNVVLRADFVEDQMIEKNGINYRVFRKTL